MSPLRPAALRVLAAALLAATGPGCGGRLPPPSPPAAPAAIPADEEQRLWARAREEQIRLDRSGLVLPRSALEPYLEEIIARLGPAPLPGPTPYRVRVVADASLNAFAYPDGAIYVHTGMLATVQDEAQIATVLAHETVHATDRHALAHQRQVRGATGFAATVTVGTLGLGALLGGVGALAAVSGYSQEHEREADRDGFALLVAAGYDPRASAEVFRLLAAEAKRSKRKEPFFFGSHPRLRERVASFEALLAALPPERRAAGERHAARYLAMIAPVLPLDAAAATSAGDPDGALARVARGLALRPDWPELLLAQADALRRRQTGDDLARALALYEQLSARPDGAPAETWRGLGLLRQKTGDRAAAALAYRRYLALAPAAPDHAFIATLLDQCTSPAP